MCRREVGECRREVSVCRREEVHMPAIMLVYVHVYDRYHMYAYM